LGLHPPYPRLHLRHTRARRGYLAEFCTEPRLRRFCAGCPAALGWRLLRSGGWGRCLVISAARYPRQARVWRILLSRVWRRWHAVVGPTYPRAAGGWLVAWGSPRSVFDIDERWCARLSALHQL